MNTRYSLIIALALVMGSVFGYAACSSDDAVTEPNPTNNSSSSSSTGGGPVQPLPDAGTQPDGAPADCYATPDDSHFQIINACTDADKITRNPTLAKLNSDGGLPDLP